MPLAEGHTSETVSANIAKLIGEGRPRAQAAAIAYKTAGLGQDMTDEDWDWLLGGLGKFFAEEREEPEHAEDDAPKGYAASIAFVSPKNRVLLLRRADTEENFPGHWAFPGGKMDDGETLEEAARREAQEEIGDCTLDGMAEFDRKRTAFGWEHATYTVPAKEEFQPKLNAEHSGYAWVPLDKLPVPIHPGVKDTLAAMAERHSSTGANDCLAFDRDTVREKDADGRLHVKVANISKAAVNPYYGREIPNADQLGLDADKIYYLLRHPDELKKAASTFDGIPLQIAHKPTSAEDHQSDITVGATGTEAHFEHPFLKNSLVIWPEYAIDAVESGAQRELSCGYKYDADMTPGEYEGQHYDGVMRNIVGNHVALVESGRAGPDVVVGDSALGSTTTTHNQEISMGKDVLTRKAAVAQGAVLAHLRPLLAADAAIDLGGAFVGITSKNMKEKRQSIVDALKPKLKLKAGTAMDAALKAIGQALDEAEPMDVEEGLDTDPNSGLPMSAEEMRKKVGDDHPLLKELEGKVSPEIMARIKEALGEHEAMDEDDKRRDGESDDDYLKRIRAKDAAKARDAEPEAKPEVVTKAAMDKAIEERVAAERKRLGEAHEALVFVEPWVGRITQAHDSAESVFRATLGMLKVPHQEVKDPAALKHIIAAQPKPNERRRGDHPVHQAHDSAAVESFDKMFPGADRIGRAA